MNLLNEKMPRLFVVFPGGAERVNEFTIDDCRCTMRCIGRDNLKHSWRERTGLSIDHHI